MAERALRLRVARGTLMALALLALLPSLDTARVWLQQRSAARHVVGLQSARQYAAGHLRGYTALMELINHTVPPDGKLLMLFEYRGFGLEPPVLQDHEAMTWPLLATNPASDDCLAGTGITHVLFGTAAVRAYVRRGGADSSVLRLKEFRGFATRCLEAVYRSDYHELYRVTPQAVEGSAGTPAPPGLRREATHR